jgi:hypothetical protein
MSVFTTSKAPFFATSLKPAGWTFVPLGAAVFTGLALRQPK